MVTSYFATKGMVFVTQYKNFVTSNALFLSVLLFILYSSRALTWITGGSCFPMYHSLHDQILISCHYFFSCFWSKIMPLHPSKQVLGRSTFFYKFPINPRAATTTTSKATTVTMGPTTSASTTPASSAPSTSSPGTSRRARQATSTRSRTSGPPLEVNRERSPSFGGSGRHFLRIYQLPKLNLLFWLPKLYTTSTKKI